MDYLLHSYIYTIKNLSWILFVNCYSLGEISKFNTYHLWLYLLIKMHFIPGAAILSWYGK